jgi:hypothetical protein
MDDIRKALREGTSMSRASVQSVLHKVQTKETPPTYFRNEPIAKGTQANLTLNPNSRSLSC